MFIAHTNYAEIAIRIVVAAVIGCFIGIEREYKNRPAGMRTHLLVALGAMSIAMIESLAGYELAEELKYTNVHLNIGRLSCQVISGIGFLGAGTIFMNKRKIGGLTTAASLWCTACLGVMTGFGHYVISGIIFMMIILTLSILQKVVRVNAIKTIEVKFINRVETMQFINDFFEHSNIKVLDVDFYIDSPDSGKKQPHIYRNIYTIKLPPSVHYTSIVVHLSEYVNIQAVHTRNV